jgi:hypothetical protein
MKEFTSAVEDIEAEDARNAKIAALVAEGKTQEEAEAEVDAKDFTPFKIDGHELHAFKPTEGQLIFMLASLGRGQTKDQRFAAIINVMLASLRSDDKDWLETRLLESDPKQMIHPKVIEQVFEYLTEEWFANPTQ